jgi:hypothetical protein
MDNKPKKNVKKPKKEPKKKAPKKRTRAQARKDKSVKQNVNVNVTSSGGTGSGSGGSAIPSAQPQYNPFLQASMNASREENTNLIKQLEELKNKQDKGNQLLRDIQRKPEDMGIKEDIKQVLQDEQQMESNIIDDITAQEEMPSSSSMETPTKNLTPYQRKKERKAERDSIITAIQELGGTVPSNIKTKGLKDYLDELLQIERDVNNEGKNKEI